MRRCSALLACLDARTAPLVDSLRLHVLPQRAWCRSVVLLRQLRSSRLSQQCLRLLRIRGNKRHTTAGLASQTSAFVRADQVYAPIERPLTSRPQGLTQCKARESPQGSRARGDYVAQAAGEVDSHVRDGIQPRGRGRSTVWCIDIDTLRADSALRGHTSGEFPLGVMAEPPAPALAQAGSPQRSVDSGGLAALADHAAAGGPLQPALPVVHSRQVGSWDCGLACANMVLRAFAVPTADAQDLYRCKIRSIWTVDLAHMLAARGCNVCFCTRFLGANPGYSKEVFYRTHMSADRVRVDRLFREAAGAGIVVRQTRVPWQSLRDALAGGCHLVVLLVDKWRLKDSPGCLCGLVDPCYTGHYVVLSAFDADRGVFVVQDPACSGESRCMDPASLDRARCCFGTDEDLLLVSRHKPCSTASERSCQDDEHAGLQELPRCPDAP